VPGRSASEGPAGDAQPASVDRAGPSRDGAVGAGGTSGGGAGGTERGAPTGRGGTGSGGGLGAGLGVREGSTLALAVPGEGGGDGAEYAGYFALLRQRVHESLRYPGAARRRGVTGTVQVDLEIDPRGVIGRIVLAASSSHALLDDAALEAVRRLERVPFPAGIRPRHLRVRLPVVFDLR